MPGTFSCFDREFPVGLSSQELHQQAELIAQSKRMDLVEVEEVLKQAQTETATKLNNAKRKANGPSYSFSLC